MAEFLARETENGGEEIIKEIIQENILEEKNIILQISKVQSKQLTQHMKIDTTGKFQNTDRKMKILQRIQGRKTVLATQSFQNLNGF